MICILLGMILGLGAMIMNFDATKGITGRVQKPGLTSFLIKKCSKTVGTTKPIPTYIQTTSKLCNTLLQTGLYCS